MITEQDLIGTWRIIRNVVKDNTGERQAEIDKINAKYEVTYKPNGTYSEVNNGIIVGRFSNFNGAYSIDEGDMLRMSVKSFAFKRSYKLISISDDKSEISLSPCDSLYCGIYSNIDYIVIKKI